MRFALFSDLHLEIKNWEPPALEVDAVILAGDIGRHTCGLVCAAATFRQPVIPTSTDFAFPTQCRRSGNKFQTVS
jgi:hypothetical protein